MIAAISRFPQTRIMVVTAYRQQQIKTYDYIFENAVLSFLPFVLYLLFFSNLDYCYRECNT